MVKLSAHSAKPASNTFTFKSMLFRFMCNHALIIQDLVAVVDWILKLDAFNYFKDSRMDIDKLSILLVAIRTVIPI